MAHIHHNMVFGLDWRTAINDGRQELLSIAREFKGNAYVEVAWSNECKYGIANLKKIGGVRSAAAVLTELLRGMGGVFVHRISAELSCCIAVSKNFPVEQMDLVGSRQQMLEQARAYMERRRAQGELAQLHGDVLASELSDCRPLALEGLQQEAEGVGQLKVLTPTNWRLLAACVGVPVLVLAWFSPELSAAMAPPPPANPQLDQKLQYREQMRVALRQVEAGNRFPAAVMAGFRPFARTIAGRAADWRLSALSCRDTACNATWKRQQGATTAELLDALGVAQSDAALSFPDMNHVTRSYQYSKPPAAAQLRLASRAQFAHDVLSWFQRADESGAKFVPGVPTPLVAPPAGMPPDAQAVTVTPYTFTLPYSAANMDAVAAFPPSMTIDGIELKLADSGVSVEINGKYYVR